MRGRRPKPTALKQLQGNPGKRKLNDREPRPAPAGVPPCPDYLDAVAKKEWVRMSHLLEPLGLLTAIDGTALALFCQAYSRWLEADRQIRQFGAVIKTPTGFPILNPYLSVMKGALAQMNKLIVEFGMTPSSRSRLRIEPPSKTAEDPLDAFLKRGAANAAERVQ